MSYQWIANTKNIQKQVTDVLVGSSYTKILDMKCCGLRKISVKNFEAGLHKNEIIYQNIWKWNKSEDFTTEIL